MLVVRRDLPPPLDERLQHGGVVFGEVGGDEGLALKLGRGVSPGRLKPPHGGVRLMLAVPESFVAPQPVRQRLVLALP